VKFKNTKILSQEKKENNFEEWLKNALDKIPFKPNFNIYDLTQSDQKAISSH